MSIISQRDRDTADAIARRGPDGLRGIHRDELCSLLAGHRGEPVKDLLIKMFSGWILHEASYVPREGGPGEYSITLEQAMTEACAGDAREGILLSLFGHWSNDIISMAAHYGVGLARRQPDGTMLHDDGTVDTIIKGGVLTMIVVPPPPSPAHYWSAGQWNELEMPEDIVMPPDLRDDSLADGGV